MSSQITLDSPMIFLVFITAWYAVTWLVGGLVAVAIILMQENRQLSRKLSLLADDADIYQSRLAESESKLARVRDAL